MASSPNNHAGTHTERMDAMQTEKLKNSAKQFTKFIMVGGINTGVDLAILNVLTLMTDVTDGPGYAIQKGISFFAAVIGSYFLNKYWTFRATDNSKAAVEFSQFFGVSLIGAVVNVTAATIAVTYIKPLVEIPFLTDQLWVSIGALFGTAFGLLWNFVGYKFFVFKK